MNDILYSVILNADYESTMKLLQSIPHDNNIWKNKFEYKFPNGKLFDFWTYEQNYIIQEKQYFALILNFDDEYFEIENMIEWSPLLSYCINLASNNAGHLNGIYYSVIKIFVREQFVLIKCDANLNCFILGQFSNQEDAQPIIDSDKLTLVDQYDIDYTYYQIIDLKDFKPCTLKLGFKGLK